MSLMPRSLFSYSYFRLAASLSGIFLVFQGLVWVLVTSSLEETFLEANISELYSLTLELEKGGLHAHGGDFIWGVGDNIDPSIQRAFKEEQSGGSVLFEADHNLEIDETVFGLGDEDQDFADDDEGDGNAFEWGLFEFVYNGQRYLGEMSSNEGTQQYVAVNIDHQHERIEALNVALLFTTIATFLIAMGISYAIAFASQRKVTKIQTALSLLSSGDMGARCDLPPSNDDVSNIAQRLDEALERLQAVTEQTKLFGKNLAHDLRTPLARLRASLEGINRDHDVAPALAEVDRIALIVDGMMRIARLQSEANTTSLAPINLKSFAQRLHETYEPVLPERKTLVLEMDEDSVVMADEVLLEQAIANLLQNAIVYGGDCITLFGSNGAIGISDDGPGVPEDQFDEIIKPSVQLDPSRGAAGAGLGLAFVKAVADHHGGTLRLRGVSPKGFEASLVLKLV